MRAELPSEIKSRVFLWVSGGNCMRSKWQQLSIATCMLLSVISATSLNASFRPTFNLDGCSWNATHIVLVQTTGNEGIFSVVESWKADLKPGESLELSELKPKENAVPIPSYPKPAGFDLQDGMGISEQIPRQPVGSRMILFLKEQKVSGAGTSAKWGPASAWGGIKVSVLWIDGGKAFCFQQSENPGPSALSQCWRWPAATSSDVAVFSARIQEVLQAQRDLAETLALKDVDVRAERLGRVALGDVYPAQKEAIDALGKAGTVALPEILQVMDNPPGRFYDGDALIRVFVEAAGEDGGRQLHARLQQDVIYWETVGPTLTQNWLGHLIEVGSPLFVKFNETLLLVRELGKEHYAPAAQTVAELRRFWISQPQLYDPKWGEDGRNGEVRTSVTGQDIVRSYAFGLAKECDAFLKSVGEKTDR